MNTAYVGAHVLSSSRAVSAVEARPASAAATSIVAEVATRRSLDEATDSSVGAGLVSAAYASV